MCSQCAPRSYGTPKVRVSVKQRPPMRSLASISAKRRPAAATLRAAAIPAAPAPMIATSVSPEADDRAERRRGGERRRAGEKNASIDRHGFQNIAPRRNIARSNGRSQTRASETALRNIAYSFTACVNRNATPPD